jgi:hypothetical protein
MHEYQLTIHDDLTSTLVFGSRSPEEVTDSDSDFTPNTFVAPEFPEILETQANITRSKRNVLLMECDWTQAADTPLSDEVKALWATYRTSLRDLSGNSNWPFLEEADWPTKP